MGFGFRVAKGVRVYPSSRGVSFGSGNVRYYHSMRGGSRSRGGSSVVQRQQQVQQAERLQEIERLSELDVELARFCEVHKASFPESRRPTAPDPDPVDEHQLRKELEKAAIEDLSILRRAERKAAKDAVRAGLPEKVETERQRRVAERELEQQEMDAEWDRLLANDPETVTAVLEAHSRTTRCRPLRSGARAAALMSF